jgi:hypothetical protein
MAVAERVAQLDISLFDMVGPAWTSPGDVTSLLALHAVLAERGDFAFVEIGSYLGRSLQAALADPRCVKVTSIDRRDEVSPDERGPYEYKNNTTANMLAHLARVSDADLSKLETIDDSTENIDPGGLRADLCFIDGEHTDTAAFRDARFCRSAIRDRGVIAFHDRTIVERGIVRFLRELDRYRAYPLAHDLFVVELGVPTLLNDARVRRQIPRPAWLWIERVRLVRAALELGGVMRGFH